jgi:hypothetical protein
MGLLVVGPLQVWILIKYGLAAKIAANPVVVEARRQPFAVKTALVILSSFVGWGPLLDLARWLRNPHPAAPALVVKEGYWLITSFITTLSGTLVGLLFPFLFVPRARKMPSRPAGLLNRWNLAGIGFAVVANAMLSPFYSDEGTMQNALVPLALGLYGLFACQLTGARTDEPATLVRLTCITAAVGTIPWFLLNTGTSVGFWLSSSFRERFRTGSEGDYFLVIDNHLAPLGMASFPQVPALCFLLLVIWIGWQRRGGAHSPMATPPR